LQLHVNQFKQYSAETQLRKYTTILLLGNFLKTLINVNFYFSMDFRLSPQYVWLQTNMYIHVCMCNKLTHDNFDMYSLCVAIVYIVKWHQFIFQFHNVKIVMSHFRQLLRWRYCNRSCFLQSVMNDRPAFSTHLHACAVRLIQPTAVREYLQIIVLLAAALSIHESQNAMADSN